MALTRDYLESIIWPRYSESSSELCQALWVVANPKLANVPSPAWFNEIIEVQLKSILMLVFSTPQQWIVLPEPLPGITVVVCKKQQGAASEAPQQRLSLKSHSFDQFNELAQLVERAMVKLVKRALNSGSGDVIELENEDGHIFCFPRSKLTQYLTALGFSPDLIPNLLSLDDIEGF